MITTVSTRWIKVFGVKITIWKRTMRVRSTFKAV